MEILPAFNHFGEPAKRITTPDGNLLLWSAVPFLVTRVEGYASLEMGLAIDAFYKDHFPRIDFVVTVHDWSNFTEYDSECRRIMQQLVSFMKSKQREIIIHLGPATSLGQKAVRVTAKTISKFRKIPIELFSSDKTFEERVRALLDKYRPSS
jgi:hypothetical protein